MKIVVYLSFDAPQKLRAVAYISSEGEYLPVRFFGATVDEVETKAQAHWDKAMARQEELRRNAEARAAKRARPTATAPTIEEVV